MGNRIDLEPVPALPTHFPIDQRSIGGYLSSTTTENRMPEVTNDSGAAMHCAWETSRHMSEKAIPKNDVYRIRNLLSTTTPDTNSVPKNEDSPELDQDHNAI